MAGSRLLIVNADDYGLDPDIDAGILYAGTHGVVTSTTVLATGRSFLSGAAALRASGLGVGVHLALCGDLPTAAPAREVPSLIHPRTGRLRPGWLEVGAAMLAGRLRPEQIRREFDAQIGRVRDAGITPDHVDGHQHLHVLPGVFEIVLELCARHGIRALRLPREPLQPGAGFTANLKRHLLAVAAHAAATRLPPTLHTTGGFTGVAWSGRLTRTPLLRVIAGLAPGTHEIGCHPGRRRAPLPEHPRWSARWSEELDALTSDEVRVAIRRRGVTLARWSDAIPSQGAACRQPAVGC